MSVKGGKHSQKSRECISNSKLGYIVAESTKVKLSESWKDRDIPILCVNKRTRRLYTCFLIHLRLLNGY